MKRLGESTVFDANLIANARTNEQKAALDHILSYQRTPEQNMALAKITKEAMGNLAVKNYTESRDGYNRDLFRWDHRKYAHEMALLKWRIRDRAIDNFAETPIITACDYVSADGHRISGDSTIVDERIDEFSDEHYYEQFYPTDELYYVESGTYKDPYSGRLVDLSDPKAQQDRKGDDLDTLPHLSLDLDHVVSLKNAWATGGASLYKTVLAQIAHDPLNLRYVSQAANNNKLHYSAADWLPANQEYILPYIANQIAVKSLYNLWLTRREQGVMLQVVDRAAKGEPYDLSQDEKGYLPDCEKYQPRGLHSRQLANLSRQGSNPRYH